MQAEEEPRKDQDKKSPKISTISNSEQESNLSKRPRDQANESDSNYESSGDQPMPLMMANGIQYHSSPHLLHQQQLFPNSGFTIPQHPNYNGLPFQTMAFTPHNLQHLHHQFQMQQAMGMHQNGNNSSIQQQLLALQHIPSNNISLGMPLHLGLPPHMQLSQMGHTPAHMMMFSNPQNQQQMQMPTNIVPRPSQFPLDTSNKRPDNQRLPKKQRKDLPEWVVVFGEACHSPRQLQSGQDLSKIKKKYKLIKCSTCEEFNSQSPWATLKSRKFETENFVDHERSTHHIKAALRRNSTGDRLFHSAIHELSQSSSHDNQQPFIHHTQYQPHILSQPTFTNQPHYQQSNNTSGTSDKDRSVNQMIPLFGHSTFSQNGPIIQHQFVPGIHMTQPITFDVRREPGLTVQSEGDQQKSKVAPPWLKTEGKLCHSETQVAQHTPEELNSIKKKYKKLMCTYCHEFNTAAPWAHMKTRKYESSVLNEHERSHHHRKSVNARNSSMGTTNFEYSSLPYISQGPYDHLKPISITGLGSLQLAGIGYHHNIGSMPQMNTGMFVTHGDGMYQQQMNQSVINLSTATDKNMPEARNHQSNSNFGKHVGESKIENQNEDEYDDDDDEGDDDDGEEEDEDDGDEEEITVEV